MRAITGMFVRQRDRQEQRVRFEHQRRIDMMCQTSFRLGRHSFCSHSAHCAPTELSSVAVQCFKAPDSADVCTFRRDADADEQAIVKSWGRFLHFVVVGAQHAAAVFLVSIPQDSEFLVRQHHVEPEHTLKAEAKLRMLRLRMDLLDVHERHRESLPPAVIREMNEQLLRAVDSHESMVVALKVYTRKLGLLANKQADCPLCFERFGDDEPPEVLRCCHAFCQECWQDWTSTMHGRPFCPVCRDAFPSVMTSQVAAAVPSQIFLAMQARRLARARRWPVFEFVGGIISALMPCQCCLPAFSCWPALPAAP